MSTGAFSDCAASVAVFGDNQSIHLWLEEFASAVRAVDYRRGMRLFAPDVLAFGTRNERLVGLEMLVERQWKQIWGVTSGFRFDSDRVVCGRSGLTAWAAAPWESQGRRANGATFERRGRATFVLEDRDGCWLAVHSHLSMNPSSADLSRIGDPANNR